MEITNDIKYVGVNDHEIDLFEGQYMVENGMAYNSYVILDAFDKGSYIKVIPEENKIIGYSTKNSGGVPENFKNYFVVQFDKPFTFTSTVSENRILPNETEAKGNHTGAVIGFATKKGEIVHARVASSFISPEQAELNLKELGNKTFDQLVSSGRNIWNREMGKVEIEDDNIDNLRTFYSCLYRSMLFPRSFYEIDAKGQVMHYSPYNGKVLPGYMFTDTGFWDYVRTLDLNRADYEKAVDMAPSIKPFRHTYLHEENYRSLAKQLLREDPVLKDLFRK